MLIHHGSNSAVKPLRLIVGTKLQRDIHKISEHFRALLSAEWQAGDVSVTGGSPKQAAFLFRCPMGDARTILAATPLEVEAVKRGRLTIEAMRRRQLANEPSISNEKLRAIILRAGLGRVLEMLDELTAPEKTNGHDAANDNSGNGGAILPVQLSL